MTFYVINYALVNIFLMFCYDLNFLSHNCNFRISEHFVILILLYKYDFCTIIIFLCHKSCIDYFFSDVAELDCHAELNKLRTK